MTIDLPLEGKGLLLLVELAFCWVATTHYLEEPTNALMKDHEPMVRQKAERGMVAGCLMVSAMVITQGPVTRRMLLGAMMMGIARLLLFVRHVDEKSKWSRWQVESELLAIPAVLTVIGLVVGRDSLTPRPLITMPIADHRLTALLAALGVLTLLGNGGTRIVRGVLQRAKVQPKSDIDVLDEREYNRGRLIGLVERFILAILTALAAYTALGFIIAAKGLVRSKDLERHDFAEYFLIGTLCSSVIALTAGLAMRGIFLILWQ